MTIWQKLMLWFDHLIGLHIHGHDVPSPPQVTGGPVVVPTNPTLAPAPSAPPKPSTHAVLPDGVLEIDARGFVKLAAVENERANNPLWANACTWYVAEGLENETFEARANLTEAKIQMLTAQSTGRFDASSLNTAYQMGHDTRTGSTGQPVSFGYVRGLPYGDALAFPGDNADTNGIVVYKGFRPSDGAAFVANCNAAYAAAQARGEDAVRLQGNLPIINHTQSGPVAV